MAKIDAVTHEELFVKLVEHEEQITSLIDDVHGIKEALGPISVAVKSMAWSFKALVVVGAGSASLVGVIELIDHIK